MASSEIKEHYAGFGVGKKVPQGVEVVVTLEVGEKDLLGRGSQNKARTAATMRRGLVTGNQKPLEHWSLG